MHSLAYLAVRHGAVVGILTLARVHAACLCTDREVCRQTHCESIDLTSQVRSGEVSTVN